MDRPMFSPFTVRHGQGGIRNFDIFCSDMAGSTRMNQDQYHSTSYDGLLLECTYIADGTEVEFTVDPTVTLPSLLRFQQPGGDFR